MPKYITMRELNAKAQELGTVGEALKWAKANGFEVDTGSDFAVLPPEEGEELPPVSNQTTANTLAVMPDQEADTEEGALAVPAAGEEAPAATGPLSEMDALRAEIKGLPEKQKLAYDQIFRQGQDYISKMYPTPTRSQLLSSMSKALLSPTKYRGFAATMYNMASGLEEIDKSREEAMRKRMEAEQKLQQTLALAGTGDTAKALQLRYQLIKEENDAKKDAALLGSPKYDPLPTGGYQVRPGTGGMPQMPSMDQFGNYVITDPRQIAFLPANTRIVRPGDDPMKPKFVPARPE